MAADQKVLLLKRKLMEGMSQQAWVAGMSVKSARSWQRCALPSEKRSEAFRLLSAAYDSSAGVSLLPLLQMDSCNTCRALDDAVCSALGLDAELVSTVRRQLAAEPSVTGKRYTG